MLQQRIQQHFFDSADLHYAAADALSRPIADAAQALVGCVTAGGKVLACGSGEAATSAARHFAARFIGGFERERPGLAALALTADAAPAGGDEGDAARAFVQQVQALGAPGDVLLAVGAGAASAALDAAIVAAKAKDMTVLALTGQDADGWHGALTDTDVHIAVPHERAARVHEVHLLVVHCLCDAVDLQLLGEEEPS